MYIKTLFSAAALAVLPLIASADQKGFVMECDINVPPGRWVAPSLALIFAEDGKVQAIDETLIAYKQFPTDVTVSRNDDRTFRGRWRLKDIRDKSNVHASYMDYEVNLKKSSGRVRVTARPFGYEQAWSHSGTCKRAKKK